MSPSWIHPLRSRRGQGLVVCFILGLSLVLFHTPPSSIKSSSTKSKMVDVVSPGIDNATKFILYYNNYWNDPEFQFGTGRQPFLDYNCPIHNCWAQSLILSKNDQSSVKFLQNFSRYDAVLFSVQAHDGFDLGDEFQKSNIESWRQPHQRFVFFIMESQAFPINNLRSMNGFFNWTMTFRWDSSIPRPYGWFEETSSSPQESFVYPSRPKQWIPYNEQQFRDTLSSRPKEFLDLAKRPGKVAWIVSHCGTESRREDYVYQLRQYIVVDEFGGQCQFRDSPTCDQPYSIRRNRLDNCTLHVQRHYKFYLAFENQFCNEYATEKFFQRMERSVVITLGQANYSDIAPPHSSISIFDFDNARDLAEYLHHLDQNDAAYLSYFWWMDYYRVKHPRSGTLGSNKGNNFGYSMCHLCQKLHDPNEPSHVYDDIYQWWQTSAECGKRLHGFKARLANDPGLSGFRSDGKNNINLATFVRKHSQTTTKDSTTRLRNGMNQTNLP